MTRGDDRTTAAAAEQAAEVPPDARRNHVVGVAAGAMGGLGYAFLHPEIIVAGMVYALTQSAMLVALVSIVNKAGAMGPQLLASTYLEHKPRKMPSFRLLAVIRTCCFAGLVVAGWRMARRVDGASVAFFFLAYLAICVCSGATHVTSMEMLGRMIRPDRLGLFLGSRTFLGTALGIAAGAIAIQPLLDGIKTEMSYVVLLLIGAVIATGDVALFSLSRERDGPRARRRTTLRESLLRGLKWVRRDHNYRMFLFSRVAFRINYLALAFFIPYGSERLHRSEPGGIAVLGGIFVAALHCSRLAASVVWGKMADRWGFRPPLIGAGALFMAAPLLALLAPLLPGAFLFRLPGGAAELDLPLVVYMFALMALGAAMQGNIMGGQYFLVTNAPRRRRASYMGFLNTVTSPLTLLPLCAAAAAHWVGMSAIFFFAAGGGALSLAAAVRMRPARDRTAAAAGGGD